MIVACKVRMIEGKFGCFSLSFSHDIRTRPYENKASQINTVLIHCPANLWSSLPQDINEAKSLGFEEGLDIYVTVELVNTHNCFREDKSIIWYINLHVSGHKSTSDWGVGRNVLYWQVIIVWDFLHLLLKYLELAAVADRMRHYMGLIPSGVSCIPEYS